ncbi:MAG: hypothetical protein IT367_20490 [Candidatus Hydrogenedentes bacterium]|nr:hypothetical protein [Candidatus Hydrogenedentota bacterium]
MTTFGVLILIGMSGALLYRDYVQTNERDKDTAKRMAQLAISLQSKGDIDKALTLEQLAYSCMQLEPGESAGVWEIVSPSIEKLIDNPREQINRFDAFDEELRHSLMSCASVQEFDSSWEVLSSVKKKRAEAIRRLKNQILNSITELGILLENEDKSASDVLTLVSDFAAGGGVEDIRMCEYNEDTDSLDSRENTMGAGIKGVSATLLVKLDLFISILAKSLDSEAEKDAEGQIINPSDANVSPFYQNCLLELDKLHAQLEDDNISEFVSLADHESIHEFNDTATKITDLQTRCAELQGIRYNVWALNQIRQSSTSESGVGLLAAISLPLLTPAVASEYLSVQEDLLRKIAISSDRDISIRYLLTAIKIGLERF